MFPQEYQLIDLELGNIEAIPREAFASYYMNNIYLDPTVYQDSLQWNPAWYLLIRAEDKKSRSHGCKAPAQPITGDCGFCQKRFCSKHRMLESHVCEGLEDAKRAERDRNREKLEKERMVMVRGI
jgi:AN1-like Zinc finger